ncbi:MAG: MFS transporter [Betaproteobacteria bacterium]|nr:MFS transporter [Betaproteobacteria bacterium]
MQTPSKTLPLWQVLACGALIVSMAMGIRHGFGLWMQPMTQDLGWGREDFALAVGIQNISWGVFGIFSGMLADRFGAFRVILIGGLLYVVGLWGMAHATSSWGLMVTAGLLVGAAQAGTTFAVVFGVIGRNLPADKRSWAMGVVSSAGSFGQFVMVPAAAYLISQVGWQQALVLLATLLLTVFPLAMGLREPGFASGTPPQRNQSIWQALREAFGYRSFQLLMAGYFVCGFQVVFIGVHMPSYLRDQGMQPLVASTALALIGLFNIFGTYAAGSLGQIWPKHKILSGIYLARAVFVIGFISTPISPASVYIFAALMGLLWLSTVPVTNALVAQIFGVAHLSMLSGFVFLSHQIGSFLGVWLGGWVYDRTGSYDLVWYLIIALSCFAMLINLPINERTIERKAVPA